eukprot:470943-Pelagomonas_calceolata.AAC.5
MRAPTTAPLRTSVAVCAQGAVLPPQILRCNPAGRAAPACNRAAPSLPQLPVCRTAWRAHAIVPPSAKSPQPGGS